MACDRRFDRALVEHVAHHDAQFGMLDRRRKALADERGDRVALFERLLDDEAARPPGRAENDDLHTCSERRARLSGASP
jgi:hypothetical protein